MIKKTVLILSLFLLFGCSYNKTDIPHISSDEYSIYSTIMDTLIKKPGKIYIDKSTIAFYKEGPPFGFYDGATIKLQNKNKIENYFDYLVTSYKYNDKFISRSKQPKLFNDSEMFKELKLKNIYSFDIDEELMSATFPFQIFNSIDSLKQLNLNDGNAIRIGFSRVGFNEDCSKSIVYAFYYCGILCASGDYYLMQLKNSKWNVIEIIGLLVS